MQEGGNPHYGRVLAILVFAPATPLLARALKSLMNWVLEIFLLKDYFINQDYDIINQNIHFDAPDCAQVGGDIQS